MIKILNFKYNKNVFLSKIQFMLHKNIYLTSVNNLNIFLKKKNIFFKNKFELIDILPDLSDFDKNNFSNILGNYLNHEYYFNNICFNKNKCFGEILKKIITTYDNYDNFKLNFINFFKDLTGWGWIVINNNNLCFVNTYENNNPMFSIDLGGYNSIPLLCIDLHEHAYYLDYKEDKKKYLTLFLDYINWYEIENRLQNFLINR